MLFYSERIYLKVKRRLILIFSPLQPPPPLQTVESENNATVWLLIALTITLQFQGKRRAGISTGCQEQDTVLCKHSRSRTHLRGTVEGRIKTIGRFYLVRSERNRKGAVFQSIWRIKILYKYEAESKKEMEQNKNKGSEKENGRRSDAKNHDFFW